MTREHYRQLRHAIAEVREARRQLETALLRLEQIENKEYKA